MSHQMLYLGEAVRRGGPGLSRALWNRRATNSAQPLDSRTAPPDRSLTERDVCNEEAANRTFQNLGEQAATGRRWFSIRRPAYHKEFNDSGANGNAVP